MRTTAPLLVPLFLLATSGAARSDDLTAERVRRLLPAAMGLNADTWRAISTAPEPPTARSYDEYRATAMFMLTRWVYDGVPGAELRFLTPSLPSPAQCAPAFERSLARGFVSVVQAEDMSEVVVSTEGDSASGSCTFRVAGLYEGTLRFRAQRAGTSWSIVEVALPAIGLVSRRAEDGWRGSWPLLTPQVVRALVAVAFCPDISRETWEQWKRRRPELDELDDPRPGNFLLARLPRGDREHGWRLLDTSADGLPSVSTIERVLAERGRKGPATFVAPTDLTRQTLEVDGGTVKEVDARADGHRAVAAIAWRVPGLVEAEARVTLAYVRPRAAPRLLEGAWAVSRVELAGLELALEREQVEELSSWRVAPLR